MFRTRDFVLIFTTIVFLVIAIGVTAFLPSHSPSVSSGIPLVTTESPETGGAEVTIATLDRESRVRQLREKIAAEPGALLSAAPDSIPPDTAPNPIEDDVVDMATPQLCGGYQIYSGFWPLQGIASEVREGVRVYVVAEGGTSEGVPTERVLLALSTTPGRGAQHCLSSNVVGIATDGSLIRNSEASLYAIFGADTLIGYALDGHPLYGMSTAIQDECGGVATPQGYRYQLSTNRATVVNCFAGIPATLP